MSTRRDFIRTTLVVASGMTVARAIQADEAVPAAPAPTLGGLPTNLIFTAAAPGVWKAKVDSHAPQVSVADGKLTMKTKHGMNDEHYIVRHTLVSADGQVLGATTFYPSDRPESTHTLPDGFSGKLYATSFCNKHDFWVVELTV